MWSVCDSFFTFVTVFHYVFVCLQAKCGKQHANGCIELLRWSGAFTHIDQWVLVLVGLSMIRDCDSRDVWESSFIAVNMHPHHRVNLEDWLEKIAPDVRAAAKFEKEHVDYNSLLPRVWKEQSEVKRQTWMKMIEDRDGCFDIDLISSLRDAGASLGVLSVMYKVYKLK